MVVHHGSVGITRTVNEQCARRGRLRSSAAYHPASTATTGQESTETVVMMIQQRSAVNILPSPQGTASTLVVRLSKPMRGYFSSCHRLARPGLPRDCLVLRLQKHQTPRTLPSYVKVRTSPRRDLSTRLVAEISTPDFRKPFRDRDSEIFFAEIRSDPGCMKVRFLRFGQIPGK